MTSWSQESIARKVAKVLYISGSPRWSSNTDFLLERARSITGGEIVKLAGLRMEPCRSCWACQETGQCVIHDELLPILLRMEDVDAVVLGSPVYFNNVSAYMKAFMDRTWWLRGRLRNKIGGAVVVGRRYGAESALTAMHAFFLKHEMIPANRGVSGIAHKEGEIEQDHCALDDAQKLGERILELCALLKSDGAEISRQGNTN